MVANMNELETKLSGVRLKLMEKKKELRGTVHAHYRDLVGVADHAVSVSEKTELLLNASSRMATLSRALRVRAETADISGETSAGNPFNQALGGLDDSLGLVEAILTLNGRVLYSINVFDFQAVINIIETEIPWIRTELDLAGVPLEYRDMCASEQESFSGVKQRVETYCWRSLSSPSLRNLETMKSCIKLLKCLCEKSNQFWSRRSMLLSSLQSVGDIMEHFDLSIACALESGISIDEEFVAHFGGNEGKVGSSIYQELAVLQLHAVREDFFALKNQLGIFRPQNRLPLEAEADVGEILVFQARKVVFESMKNRLACMTFDFDKIEVESLDLAVENLVDQALLFDLFTREEVLSEIGRIIGPLIVSSTLESDRSRLAAVNASVLIRRIEVTSLHELQPYLSHSLSRLREFQKDCFDMFFEEALTNTAKKEESKKLFFPVAGKAGNVEIPTHCSAFVFALLINTANLVGALPSDCHSIATLSAKSTLSRYFCSFFSSNTCFPSLQSLFDLSAGIILLSSVADDPDYEYLAATVLDNLQSAVLTDQVDLLLYRDLIKTSAFLAIVRNTVIFQIFTHSNPLFSHMSTSSIDQASVTASTLQQELAHSAESAIDRFPTLPVSRAVAPKSSMPKKPPSIPSNMFSASSVSSFLNQVGKITLGSTTPPSR